MTKPKPPHEWKRKRPSDLFEDVEWLLSQNMHPELICQELRRTAEGIVAIARRHGRIDLVSAFRETATAERDRRGKRARAA